MSARMANAVNTTAEQGQATDKHADKDKAEDGTASQECTTGQCKDCECFCNKPITEEIFSTISSGQIFLGKTRDKFIDLLNTYFTKYGMNECIVKAHFLAQCAHESTQFTQTEEIHYDMRPKKDKDGNIERDEEGKEITEKYWLDAYESSVFGGQKYHGRGFIQISGRNNYAIYFGHDAADTELDSVANTLEHALGASFAYWDGVGFWGKNVLSNLAKANSHTTLTGKINRKKLGLENRKLLLKSCGKALKIQCCKVYSGVWDNGKGIK